MGEPDPTHVVYTREEAELRDAVIEAARDISQRPWAYSGMAPNRVLEAALDALRSTERGAS